MRKYWLYFSTIVGLVYSVTSFSAPPTWLSVSVNNMADLGGGSSSSHGVGAGFNPDVFSGYPFYQIVFPAPNLHYYSIFRRTDVSALETSDKNYLMNLAQKMSHLINKNYCYTGVYGDENTHFSWFYSVCYSDDKIMAEPVFVNLGYQVEVN